MEKQAAEIGVPDRLLHLPLVMDVLRRTGVLTMIDTVIHDDRRCKVSTNDCVSVMLCSVFLGHYDLWRMSDRFSPFDMATVMKDPGFSLRDFAEERLAKMLDDLFPVILRANGCPEKKEQDHGGCELIISGRAHFAVAVRMWSGSFSDLRHLRAYTPNQVR